MAKIGMNQIHALVVKKLKNLSLVMEEVVLLLVRKEGVRERE
jgi:hypothetical protein